MFHNSYWASSVCSRRIAEHSGYWPVGAFPQPGEQHGAEEASGSAERTCVSSRTGPASAKPLSPARKEDKVGNKKQINSERQGYQIDHRV